MKRITVLLITLTLVATACLSEGNVFALEPGDCFNDPDTTGEVSDVAIVDCAEPHDNEVYATYDMADSDFPGDSAVETNATENCIARFDGYVGRDYASSALAFSALFPTEQSWDADDREIVCFLYDLTGAQLTGTTKGSGL